MSPVQLRPRAAHSRNRGVQRVIYEKSMRWGALGPLRPLRGSRFALRQPDACRRGRMARDHEPCERRVALRQHSAVSPRHGLRRCLASRATTAAPAGAPSAGHEHGPKARHEITRKIPFCGCNSLMRLISCAFVCHEGGFRVSVRCRKPIGLRGGTTHGGGRRPTSRCVGTPRIRREASSGNVPSVRGRALAQNTHIRQYMRTAQKPSICKFLA